MDLNIKSITVSVSSRKNQNGSGSSDNFSSFSMEKASGEPFTVEEAVQAKMRMTRNLKRVLLLEELAQGLILKPSYESQRAQLDERYDKILKKLEMDPACLLRDGEG